ncbi:MAG: starch-binding protein [Lachnospiraceae bacterium]|nr:starch-binding protein [Lachnospiraceae bacterium]
MKKNIFKKIVASLATVAMAAGLFAAMPAEEAKAAVDWNDGTVYIHGEKISGTWDTADAKKMTHDSTSGKYTYTFDVTSGTVYEFKILQDKTWDDAWGPKAGGNFAYLALKNGSATITFDPSVASDDAVSATGLVSPNPKDEFYVVGTMNSWSFTANKMEAKDGKFVATFSGLEAGKHEFKIAQDAPTYEWYKGYPEQNYVLNLTEKSDVTITFDSASKEIDVKSVAAETESKPAESKPAESKPAESKPAESKPAESKPATSTKAPETTTEAKKGVTVEVTLDASIKWDKVYLYAFSGNNGLSKWPGIEMTAKDGKWYATIDTELTKLSYVISAGEGKEQTADIADVSGKDVKITVSAEKNDKGHFIASAKTVTTGGAGTGSAKPGDSAPIVMMLAVAAVAAGMVVASKKKTICE